MHANPIEDLASEETRERYRAFRRCLHLYCTDPVRWNTLCQEHGVLPPNVLVFTYTLVRGSLVLFERVYDTYPTRYIDRLKRINEDYPLDDSLIVEARHGDSESWRNRLNAATN